MAENRGSLNYKEINLLLEECDISGAKIEDIAQPRPDHLILKLYFKGEKKNLLFVMNQQSCRFHFTRKESEKGAVPQRFVSFLRAHARNANITSIEHVANERILKLTLLRAGEKSLFWVRMWSSAPNIIFTDEDGIIGDALFRRPKRGEIAHGFYNPEDDFREHPPIHKNQDNFTVREFPGDGDLHERVEQFFDRVDPAVSEEGLRERILNQLSVEETRIRAALDSMEKLIKEKSEYERYRQFGDIVMSEIHSIKKGDQWLVAKDFFYDNTGIEISLDAKLSGAENAEKYYRLYKKAKATLERLQTDHEAALERLVRIREQITGVEDTREIRELERIASGFARKKIQKTDKLVPGLTYYSNGFTIHVGRTAAENEELMRRHIRGNDLWLHARDFAGSSVFIHTLKGKSVPLEVLLDAGNLALFYSKGKNSARGDLYYTQAKYVKKAKTGKKGLFLPTQEKNLTVKIDLERIERLKKSTAIND